MISYEQYMQLENEEMNFPIDKSNIINTKKHKEILPFIEEVFYELLEQCYVLNINFTGDNSNIYLSEFLDESVFSVLMKNSKEISEEPELFENNLNKHFIYSEDKRWMYINSTLEDEFSWQKLKIHGKQLKYLVVEGDKTKISEEIFELENLKYLELINCVIDFDLKIIQKLSFLQVLRLDYSIFKNLPEELGNLHNLIFLSLMHTRITCLPQSIKHLRELYYLGLNDTKITEVPETVSELTKLSSLYLGQTAIKKLPESLKNLKNLEYLAIWETDISDLPDWICNLTELKGLYLGRSKRICHLPKNIGNLKFLKNLFIDGTGIELLPDTFSNLTNLEKITLANTPIRKFPLLSPMHNLIDCDLSGMILERIPHEIISEKINLYDNENFMATGLKLNNTKLLCQPISLFSHEKDFVNAYFNENKIHLNETKVVFLGDGEAGKSHIIERIIKDGKKLEVFNKQTTPGIAISEKNYQIDKEHVKLQIWDFGGQEIMHSMHRFFLTDRTLYVIVLNSRDNTQDERAKYWLNNVKSFANGCPVILILNKIDQNPSASVNERLLTNDYPQIVKTIKTSALRYSNDKFNDLIDTILETVKTFDSYAMEFPISWNNVKNELTEMHENYIIDYKYREICKKNSIEDEQIQNWLLDWFHDLGISFNYYKKDQLLGGYIVLKPHWITNAIYVILFNGSYLANNGILTISSIIELLKSPPRSVEKICYNISEVPYILGVMRKFEISYAIDDKHEFIPMMCIKNQHESAEEFAISNNLEYVMEYEYLPNNVLHKLMIKMKGDIVEDKIWLTGMILQSREAIVSALVRMHDKRIEIFIKSEDVGLYQPKEYLTEIRKHLLQINKDLNLLAEDMIIYKEKNLVEAINYNILLIHLSSNQPGYFSPVFRKSIPVKKILGLVENTYTMDQIIKLCKDNKEITVQILHDTLKEMRDMEISKEIFEADLIQNCMKLQGNLLLIQQGKENDRNTYLRDLLTAQNYLVFDQTLNGVSPGGKNSGELDLLIKNHNYDPFAVLESLNLKSLDKDYIAKHIDKVYLYDTWGSDCNYLVIYVEATNFLEFSRKYKEFIEAFEYKHLLQCIKERTKYAAIHVYDSLLLRNGKSTALTHILVQIQ